MWARESIDPSLSIFGIIIKQRYSLYLIKISYRFTDIFGKELDIGAEVPISTMFVLAERLQKLMAITYLFKVSFFSYFNYIL